MNRWARLAGLVTLWAGVELLERVAFRAGVEAAAVPGHLILAEPGEDDLEAFDASDVLTEHDLEQLRA